MSRRQVNKLGARLAANPEISAADDQLLEELIACHLAVLESARPRLDDLAETVSAGPVPLQYSVRRL
jgi:hypothetical protein